MSPDEIKARLRHLAAEHGEACDGNDVTERYFARVWNLALIVAADAVGDLDEAPDEAVARIRALQVPPR